MKQMNINLKTRRTQLAVLVGILCIAGLTTAAVIKYGDESNRHCCKVSDEAAFCLIQRPYISKTLLTRRISPRGSP